MSEQKVTAVYALRSGFICFMCVISVAALLYLSLNSQEFRDVIAACVTACEEAVISVIKLSFRIPSYVIYFVACSFYWAHCMHYKLSGVENSSKYISWLYTFQIWAFFLGLALIPGALLAAENPSIAALILFINLVLNISCLGIVQEKHLGLS